MNLTERIVQKQRERTRLIPLVMDRPRVPVPMWIRRLEAKDFTESIYSGGAYTPPGSDGAA
jgi:hypothetical protein